MNRRWHRLSCADWRTGLFEGLDVYMFNYNGVNKAVIDATTGVYTPFSDRRLKTDVEPYHNVLSSVIQLQPSTYRFKDAPISSSRSLGLIA